MTAIAARRRVARFTALLATLLLASAFAVADAGTAKAVDSFSISGHVTLPDGAPAEYMNGVTVYAYKMEGLYYQGGVTLTEGVGNYQIAGLPAGTYKVVFEMSQYWDGDSYEVPNLVDTTYDGKDIQDLYTPVDLTVGDQEGIDATLEWGSTLAGTVTLAADVPAAWKSGVTVWAERDDGVQFSTPADATTGGYSFKRLRPGSYLVWFDNGEYWVGGVPVGDTHFVTEYYNNVYVPETATHVTVPAHATVTGINAQLSTLRHFSTMAVPTIKALSLKVGATLGSSTGAWTPAATFTYRWKRDGASISGATASTYTLKAADVGKKITVTVTGTRDGFTAASKTSAAKYIPKVFAKTVSPTITGTARAGYRLTAHRGTWSPTATYSYQWYRNGAKITGATGYAYKLTSTDKGKKIQVKVTGKRTGYTTVTRTSASKTIAW